MSEETIHKQIVKYLKLQYPNVLFNSDMSGVKLPIGLAKKVASLRSSRAFPDIFISEPKGQYCGCYIELKADDVKVYKKDGSLYADEHIKEQYEMLKALNARGYYANFACGFDQAKKIIDKYLSLKD